MRIVYPQLDGVKINENRTLPFAILQAIRKAYDYLAQLATTSTTNAVVIEDLHVNRETLHPPGALALGSWYVETDRSEALYVVQEVSSAKAWVLVHGNMRGTLANRPADLGANDVGFFYTATDALDYRWSGTAWTTLDTVRGGANLTNAGVIPKVSAAGTLTESALKDDGTTVIATARDIGLNASVNTTIAGRSFFVAKGTSVGGGLEFQTAAADADLNIVGNIHWADINSTAADKRILLITGLLSGATANNRGGLIRILVKANGGALAEAARINNQGYWGFSAMVAPAYPIDVTGDVNVSGVYRVGTTGGATGTINLAKLTAGGANGTITVTGGIITAFTNPT